MLDKLLKAAKSVLKNGHVKTAVSAILTEVVKQKLIKRK